MQKNKSRLNKVSFKLTFIGDGQDRDGEPVKGFFIAQGMHNSSGLYSSVHLFLWHAIMCIENEAAQQTPGTAPVPPVKWS